MTVEKPILKFYKYTNNKKEIGWTNSRSDSHIIGPNMRQLFDILESEGCSERAHMYQQEGGWSGDLYVVHRRLFQFQNEASRWMGDSGCGGPLVANVYDVTINSTSGWAQYLSLVLKGPYTDEISQKLTDLDFAPKNSYLAKNDNVSLTSDQPRGLWLESIVEFPRLLPRK
jgi:hypothetical protein